MFKFLHAADLHLDSPLKGLERYDGAPVERIRTATRAALENLVRLALDEKVDFVLLAGDLYDGDWQDYNTGLFFVGQMSRLQAAGIRVVAIAGNHDAANKMTKALRMPDNVTILSADTVESLEIEKVDVVIHGQSFATPSVLEDLSANYPANRRGLFNIGLLHTCATGQDGHERYAPCTVEGLRGKGYDYWALGHIHKRDTLCADPPIVFPGNIQGRHIRETGPKGCMLVTVDGRRSRLEFRRLDVLQWALCRVDASALDDLGAVLDAAGDQLAGIVKDAEERLSAVRVEIFGCCPCHEDLLADSDKVRQELRARALTVDRERLWLEQVRLRTIPASRATPVELGGALDTLVAVFDELRGNPLKLGELAGELAQLGKKLPGELQGADEVSFADPEWINGVLEEARPLLFSRLLEREAGR
jgi:DNA repair exonuclease SbcCD nuclease subunit